MTYKNMENITLAQLKEMSETELQDILGEFFKQRYENRHVAKINFTANLIKEEYNIVLKF
jgi:hypothetical protein